VPDYRYTDETARYYPSLGIEAVPAGTEGGPTIAEFDEQPAPPAEGEEAAPVPEGARYVPDDGRWEPVKAAAKKKPTPAPSAPAAADTGQKEG
jgi:hypothetical protein